MMVPPLDILCWNWQKLPYRSSPNSFRSWKVFKNFKDPFWTNVKLQGPETLDSNPQIPIFSPLWSQWKPAACLVAGLAMPTLLHNPSSILSRCGKLMPGWCQFPVKIGFTLGNHDWWIRTTFSEWSLWMLMASLKDHRSAWWFSEIVTSVLFGTRSYQKFVCAKYSSTSSNALVQFGQSLSVMTNCNLYQSTSPCCHDSFQWEIWILAYTPATCTLLWSTFKRRNIM